MRKYVGEGDIINIILEDYTGRKILKHRSNAADVRRVAEMINEVVNKLGLPIYIRYYNGKDYQDVKNQKFEW